MATENFNPQETRKSILFATFCIVLIILAMKFNFSEFYQFLIALKPW